MSLKMKIGLKKLSVTLLAFTVVALCLWGCSRTIQEQKGTDSDPGNSTQLKFTGNKVKVVHDF